MNIIIGILLGILVLTAIFLVLIILAQDDGSDGAGIIFGSAASQQYGAKKGNIVTRTTGILATLFILVTLTLSFLFQYNNEDVDIFDETPADATYEWWDASSSSNDEVPLNSPATSIKDIDSEDNQQNGPPNKDPFSEEKTTADESSSTQTEDVQTQ